MDLGKVPEVKKTLFTHCFDADSWPKVSRDLDELVRNDDAVGRYFKPKIDCIRALLGALDDHNLLTLPRAKEEFLASNASKADIRDIHSKLAMRKTWAIRSTTPYSTWYAH
jgi:hypothetical protein